MATKDPAIVHHLEWIGFVRPTGLVVSAPALVQAGAILNRNDIDGQERLRACVDAQTPTDVEHPCVTNFRAFADTVLAWQFSPRFVAGGEGPPIPAELEVALPEYGETLRPDYAVGEPDATEGGSAWQLLVLVLPPEQEFDHVVSGAGRLDASPHSRLERLLRVTGVRAGVLSNGRTFRLLSAPRGESSGWMDFHVADMMTTAGRPIAAALRLLLGEERLLSLPRAERLPALLESSRKFQNDVSIALAKQVLHGLYELVRGLQAAHDASKQTLLREALDDDPNSIYHALLTVILRLIFVLYAEERDMLPADETFVRSYSLAGLYDRLQEDAALYPDTLDQRYGAWPQLLALFRLVYDGADTGTMRLPARHGLLFDPDRFPFLEGRSGGQEEGTPLRIDPPLIPDGTIYRTLHKLLVLDGERLSFRALDVEQIGSIYETMMGFRLEQATGRSVAVKAPTPRGAPSVVDLDALLAVPPARRGKWVQDRTARKLTAKLLALVKAAETLEDVHRALEPVIETAATPDLVPSGGMVLQPNDERRQSGSHYTPRELTEPIVRTALAPIFRRLQEEAGGSPPPEAILRLQVCDPAMGSGAFLVEACRQLSEALVEAWHVHNVVPEIPTDEDERLYARRLIAQRCLYGVDRNPVAADLAKVSLWLATLASDHPLTFLDHALRHGDSLVGLSRRQIEALHWDATKPILQGLGVHEAVAQVFDLRRRIREADDTVSHQALRDLWDDAQKAQETVRRFGDLIISAFIAGKKPAERESNRQHYSSVIISGDAARYREQLETSRFADPPVVPFYWELEFPEVFDGDHPGFDAIIGNPPFQGKNSMAASNVDGYPEWLKQLHAESHGNADLVAHFFRRAFTLLRADGVFGLIATNTIAQGDTRPMGLRWICQHGGEIVAARRRVSWPGLAAVVVSVVHVIKGKVTGARTLDDRPVETITAFLFHRGGHEDPVQFVANKEKSFQGSIVLGMGFTFDDTDTKGVASSLAEMRRLIKTDPGNQQVIFPYIGGAEVNQSPTHAHHRYVINFGDLSEDECRQSWPDLMAIIEGKVRPNRAKLTRNQIGRSRAKYWWLHASSASTLYGAIAGLKRVLVTNAQASPHLAFVFHTPKAVFANSLNVFPFEDWPAFTLLQGSVHEIWARFFSSSMKDDLRYNPSDCFETFPFPEQWQTDPTLEAAGTTYYEFRANLMVRNNEGLTTTYNRFHDPYEHDPEIQKLRELHAAMDRAVLDAYGWHDIATDCEFLLDYAIDESTWGTKKKKPYHYRWPAAVRDEVLARLLELNAVRAKEEARAGVGKPTTRGKMAGRKRSPKPESTGDLFA